MRYTNNSEAMNMYTVVEFFYLAWLGCENRGWAGGLGDPTSFCPNFY